MLKQFFQKLPDPLFTCELYPLFIEASKIDDPKQRMMELKKLVSLFVVLFSALVQNSYMYTARLPCFDLVLRQLICLKLQLVCNCLFGAEKLLETSSMFLEL